MGKSKGKPCSFGPCKKRRGKNQSCSNNMCEEHCVAYGVYNCVHKELAGPKLRLSFGMPGVDNKQEEKEEKIELREGMYNNEKLNEQEDVDNIVESFELDDWAPPCIECGRKTNPRCFNALCDLHCTGSGITECTYHQHLATCEDIWECARSCNLEELRKRIEEDHVDVNHEDEHRNTALYYASREGSLEIVEYLLSQGAIDDPIIKRCWWNTYDDKIKNVLNEYYQKNMPEEEEKEKEENIPSSLHDLSEDERENEILKPIAQYLHIIRKRGFSPSVGSPRFEIEQLIPDEAFKSAYETIPQSYIRNSTLDTPTPGGDIEEAAFQSALSSLNNLRDSLETKDSAKSEYLKTEAAKLCAWSLEEMLDMNSCKICFSRMSDCCIVPCGHLGFCLQCLEKIEECPTCTQAIEQKVKVYRV